jgi:hypothetical protein
MDDARPIRLRPVLSGSAPERPDQPQRTGLKYFGRSAFKYDRAFRTALCIHAELDQYDP